MRQYDNIGIGILVLGFILVFLSGYVAGAGSIHPSDVSDTINYNMEKYK